MLEQGTAVLVNKFGEPTVRCYSGNPLLAPIATPVAPRYIGPANYDPPAGATGAAPVGLERGQGWPGFAPTRIIVIFKASAIIDVFRLWDALLRNWFWRFTGIVIADVAYVAGVVPVRPFVATPAPQGSSDGALFSGTYSVQEELQAASSAGLRATGDESAPRLPGLQPTAHGKGLTSEHFEERHGWGDTVRPGR